MSPVPEEEVRKKARELWEAAGRPEGKDEEFWLEALGHHYGFTVRREW